MIVINCTQGSPEWHKARAGVITASMFATIRKKVNGLDERQTIYVKAILAGESEAVARELAGYKAAPKAESVQRAIAGLPVGEFSDVSKNYAFRLAVERIGGEALDDGFEGFFARRGHELEPAARMHHEAATGVFVDPCGFIKTEDGAFGCSADGLIGDKGGSEYKAFITPEKLRSIIIEEDISDVLDQIQGCMWISGREWWHFCLYCPALEPADHHLQIVEVKRDEEYIEKMEQDLWQFKLLVDSYEMKLRNKSPMRLAA